MANKMVTIQDAGGGNLRVTDPNVTISKNGGDQVHWKTDIQNKTFTITFDNGSPFNQSSYSVTAPATTPSGGIRGNAAAATYKYSVSGPGYNTLDPNVIVQN